MPNFQRRKPLGITPHDSFVRIAATASLSQYQHYPRVKVAGRAAFEEMQSYLANIHSGLDVIQSFEDSAGQVFDCVPIEQQPSLRGRAPMLNPPDLRNAGRGNRHPERGSTASARPMPTASRDRHGNPQQAPSGTIPIRRITLDEMVRFENLRAFFSKHPRSALSTAPVSRVRPSAPSPNSALNHRYAVGYQEVANIGGHGYISVYAPQVTSDETFSLAQHWYSGGSGNNLQTVEVGWQVYPQKYGHSQPVLFIFWTADDYNTGGAYNLDAPGFVQVNSNVTIGGARAVVSAVGGDQNEIEIAAYLVDNAWWLYIDGLAPENALGYYPTSLFGSGAMASAADTVEFGGETVSGTPPSGDWGPMGSGNFGEKGWQQSAYQRYIYYYSPDGSAQWTTLNVVTPVSACYSFSGGFDESSWGTYFFFGGPGGGDC